MWWVGGGAGAVHAELFQCLLVDGFQDPVPEISFQFLFRRGLSLFVSLLPALSLHLPHSHRAPLSWMATTCWTSAWTKCAAASQPSRR